MNTHDPKCPRFPLLLTERCWFCELIAKAREDEASKSIGTVSLGELAKAQEHTYNLGYAAALRDAVEVVKAELAALKPIIKESRPLLTDMDVVAQAEHRSITAIEALGGGR